MNNAVTVALVIALAFGAGVWTVSRQQRQLPQSQAVSNSASTYTVAYVYDGDTVKLNNGEHVRLIGIDAPEAHDNEKLTRDVNKRHISREVQLSMGQKAARYAKSFLKGQQVRLEYDVEPRDRYGRTLAYLYLADGTFVNQKIIHDGYAYPLTIPPNVKYAHIFQKEFNEAREQKRGLWQ